LMAGGGPPGAGAAAGPGPNAEGGEHGPWAKVPTVPKDFPVDGDKRYLGTVSFYSKLKGYGFVELTDKGVVPEDRLFVQWRSIKSEDRFPFLIKDMEVEFGIAKWPGMGPRGEVTLRAKDLSLPHGASVRLQDEMDAEKKSFVGGQGMRFTGSLKFFNPRSGYGYINVDPALVKTEGEDQVPAELRVERSEVNAGGLQPGFMQDVVVEFGIWKTSRDALKAYNVTLPGGVPLTQPNLEHRQSIGTQMYRGEVQMWNWRSGWGFIKADPSVPLSPEVQAKLSQQTQEAKKRAEERGRQGSEEELLYVRKDDVMQGVRLQKGTQVMFQIYVDDKGVGATQVQTV